MKIITQTPALSRYHQAKQLLLEAGIDTETQAMVEDTLKDRLVAVANNRDKAAFRVLFDFFGPKIKAFGLSRLYQQGQAMDLVQETMTTVWTKAHLFDSDRGKVTTWVFTIMRNQCFDMLRRVQHNREETFADELWPLFESGDNSKDFQDIKMDRLLTLYLGKLPKLQREIVEGIYLQELSQQELADKLEVPLGTVKSRLRLGLEKLKSLLEKHHD